MDAQADPDVTLSAPPHFLRRTFAVVTIASAMLCVLVGGAVAWNDTAISAPQTVDVGAMGFAIDYEQAPDALLGPNDGVPNHVGNGLLSNTGSLNLFWIVGTIEIFNVGRIDVGDGFFEGNGNAANCNPSNFVGRVEPVGDLAGGGELSVGAVSQDGFVVSIAVLPSAPETCMNSAVSYVVTVTMQTQPAN